MKAYASNRKQASGQSKSVTADRESVEIYTANEKSWLQPCTPDVIISLAQIQVGHLSVTDESIRILSTNESFQSSLSMNSP